MGTLCIDSVVLPLGILCSFIIYCYLYGYFVLGEGAAFEELVDTVDR